MFRAAADVWFADECCFLMKRLYLAAAVKSVYKKFELIIHVGSACESLDFIKSNSTKSDLAELKVSSISS